MQEPFGQLVATLDKARGTMGSQLNRLSNSPHPDKVRLPRLHSEARQLQGAATALLVRLMQRESDLDLIVQTKSLAAFFENAERQAASLLQRLRHAGPDMTNEQDGDDADSTEVHDEPVRTAGAGSSRPKAASSPQARNSQGAQRLAQMRLSDPRSAPEGHLRKRGSRPRH